MGFHLLQKSFFFTKREQLQELLINQLSIMQQEGRTEWFRAQDKWTWIRESCRFFLLEALTLTRKLFFADHARNDLKNVHVGFERLSCNLTRVPIFAKKIMSGASG